MTENTMDRVYRTQHLRRLREALSARPLVYLGGCFGSGKTVLLHQMAETPGIETQYLSCAAPDAAAQAEAFSTPGALLLLDDVQEMTDVDCQRRLSIFLTHLPEGAKVILAGRAPMPAWLKPHYAADRMRVFSQDFLNFTPEETAQFLMDRGLFPDAKVLDVIMKASLGWILALSLYTVRLSEDPGISMDELSNLMLSDLCDCLESEVYVSFDDRLRTLLSRLSPFTTFSAGMARVVTGSQEAPSRLIELSNSCGFVHFTPPDQFDLDPCFQQFLFRRTQAQCPESFLLQQYNNAALYFELADQITEALRYYRLAGNLQKITELLIHNSRNRPGNGHYLELEDYYRLLPEGTLRSSPELMTAVCVLNSLALNVSESERWYDALREFAKQTPMRDPKHRAAVEAMAYLDIALPHRGSAHMPALLRSAAKLALTSGFHLPEVNVAGNCPSLLNGGKDFCLWLGSMQSLHKLLGGIIEAALGRCGVGLADIALGEGLFETLLSEDDGEALSFVSRGLTAAEARGDPETRFAGVGVMSRMFVAQGHSEAAASLLRSFQGTLDEHAAIRLRQNAQAMAVRLSMLEGENLGVQAWMDEEAPDELQRFIILDRYRYLTKVRAYITRGEWALALSLLSRLNTYYELCERPYGQAEVALMTALVRQRSHQGDWQEPFRIALDLCEKYGLIRLIADEGIAVCDMAMEVITPATPYRAALLEKIKRQARRYPRYLQPLSGGKELLTDTEHTVYQLLIAGRRNDEIASVLGVTLRTVKFHTANIYRKLNVRCRAQAIARAGELGDL